MTRFSYDNFDLLIERSPAGQASGYRARVLDSPAGQASVDFTLPFADDKLDDLLAALSQATLGGPGGKAVAEAFGGQLFQAIFTGGVRDCLVRSLELTGQPGEGLRVRLRLNDVPELAGLPWEFLYEPGQVGFLALSSATPLVRYLELPQTVQSLAVKPPLRVLVMLASPPGFPPLDIESEWNKLAEALRPLQQRGLVTLERLADARLSTLQDKLRQGEYHVFHFTGHGAFDTTSQDGVLVLADESGGGQAVTARSLGDLLRDHRSLRLAVLNSCQGARSAQDDPFAGAAQSLVRSGIPAVIAMQFAIADRSAAALSRELYRALADGYPLDAALAEARKALANQEGGPGLDWATPVLFMRAPDGTIWQVEKKPANLIQVGPLALPALPVLVLLLLLVSGASFAGARALGLAGPRGPTTMQGAFNVAVADIGQLDARGQVRRSDDGDRLSLWIYQALATQLASFQDADLKSGMQLWQDSLPPSEKGVTLGVVQNEEQARQLAERIGAHMVIWGEIDANQNFTPHFYVSSQLGGDSDALIGHYQLGDVPIKIDMRASDFVNRQVTTRANALFWFTVGLRQASYGFNDKALEVFQLAEKYADQLQGKGGGQELLYLFTGQAALLSGDDNQAETALDKALTIKPEFVRAHVLMGTVYLTRAQRLTGAQRLETTDYEQAMAEYQKAITLAGAARDNTAAGGVATVEANSPAATGRAAQAKDQAGGPAANPDLVWGEGAAPLALAQAYRLEGDAYRQVNQYSEAERYYDMALEQIQIALGPLNAADEHRLLAQAYQTQGRAYWFKQVVEKAQGKPGDAHLTSATREAFQNCINQGPAAPFDTILNQRIIGQGCQPDLNALATVK